jgi:copper oxidase (laccase) domain-containing protein
MWKWPSAAWKKRNLGDLTIYQASTISWLPKITQGFTTRHGGVSSPPYNSLNLGLNVNDDISHVAANRELRMQNKCMALE